MRAGRIEAERLGTVRMDGLQIALKGTSHWSKSTGNQDKRRTAASLSRMRSDFKEHFPFCSCFPIPLRLSASSAVKFIPYFTNALNPTAPSTAIDLLPELPSVRLAYA